MDSRNSSRGQENEGDQQLKRKSQESSDHVILPSTSQQEAETRHNLATEPLQLILKVLADLERDDTKLAFPAARLIGLYRRLWESYKLEQHNLVLKEAGAHLRKERDRVQLHHDKQLSRLWVFE
ncbi:hypothetical protein N7536_010937 [Penicillium majusculum]|nr:hypothetical protein N7536_010937 [Penicillium majusculum]